MTALDFCLEAFSPVRLGVGYLPGERRSGVILVDSYLEPLYLLSMTEKTLLFRLGLVDSIENLDSVISGEKSLILGSRSPITDFLCAPGFNFKGGRLSSESLLSLSSSVNICEVFNGLTR